MPGRNMSGGVPTCSTSTLDPVVGDHEPHVVAVDLGLAHDRALEAEALRAELVALGDGLVGVAEVEGRVAEALVDEGAEAEDDHREHDEGDPPAAGAMTHATGAPGW